jgi:hypothetical protein
LLNPATIQVDTEGLGANNQTGITIRSGSPFVLNKQNTEGVTSPDKKRSLLKVPTRISAPTGISPGRTKLKLKTKSAVSKDKVFKTKMNS